MRLASLLRSLLVPANINQAGAGVQNLWQEQEFTPVEIENFCEVIDIRVVYQLQYSDA